jgi:hypothetical protein
MRVAFGQNTTEPVRYDPSGHELVCYWHIVPKGCLHTLSNHPSWAQHVSQGITTQPVRHQRPPHHSLRQIVTYPPVSPLDTVAVYHPPPAPSATPQSRTTQHARALQSSRV